MITKAIVEEVLSPYQVRIRIPLLDRALHTPLATKTENLNVATICTLPNCYINVQVGDVVFVAFEDNTSYKAVILGHLSKEATTTYANLTLNDLTVLTSTHLSSDTYIGNMTPTQLSYLSDINDSVQGQLNALKQNQERLLRAVFPQEF